MSKKRLLFLIIILAFLLRVIKVGSLPPLYTDEASFGYNAYSILKTGRDEYGEFLPVILRSFGDYKPALSAYLAIPFVAVFGLNEFSIRLPSVLLGTLTVLLVYFLTREIFKTKKYASDLALLTAFLLAVSPWHIHLSRMTMLVAIELFFITTGIYFFLKGVKYKAKFLIFSSGPFALSLYSYYGARLTIPLILFVLFFLYRKRLLVRKKEVALAGFLGFLILLPLLFTFLKNPEILTARVKWVSLFRYPEVKGQIWERVALDGSDVPLILSRSLHNKVVGYSRDILRRFLEHLSPYFLLSHGDKAAPFYIWRMGVSYLVFYPFLIWGFFYYFKNLKKEWLFILFWLIISVIPASLTAYTPAANRAFGMVIPLQILTALGLLNFFKFLKKKQWKNKGNKYYKKILVFISLFFILNFLYFLRQYFYITLKRIPDEYHYGQRELVDFVTDKEGDYDKIIASSKKTFYIYFLFYKNYPPKTYWQEAKINTTLDNYGFEYVEGFGKYNFKRDFDWAGEEKKQKILFITSPLEIPANVPIGFRTVKEILYPNGKIGIRLVEL